MNTKIAGLLSILAICYLCVYIFLVSQTSACGIGVSDIQNHENTFYNLFITIKYYIRYYISCRSINELGDALSGAFAPLAFIALTYTLILQGLDLRSQAEIYNADRLSDQYEKLCGILRDSFIGFKPNAFINLYPTQLINSSPTVLVPDSIVNLSIHQIHRDIDQGFFHFSSDLLQLISPINRLKIDHTLVNEFTVSFYDFVEIATEMNELLVRLREVERLQAKRIGLTDFLQKTFELQELLELLPRGKLPNHINQPTDAMNYVLDYAYQRTRIDQLHCSDYYNEGAMMINFQIAQTGKGVACIVKEDEIANLSRPDLHQFIRTRCDAAISELLSPEAPDNGDNK